VTFSAVVIGAGNIAAGYDSPADRHVLTHLHAIAREPRFRCVGMYDTVPARAAQQAARWGVPMVINVEELFREPLDLAVVAVPDEAHMDWLLILLEHDVRLVLCEKPLTTSLLNSRKVVEIYRNRGRALAVNYQRRFERTVISLRSRLTNGELGNPIAGVVWYSKGVLHNGSHAVDVLRYLFGEVHALSVRRRIVDFRISDPTVSGTLEFGPVNIELVGGDERLFSLFEIDLLFEKARYRYVLSGARLESFEPRPDPFFSGYIEMTRVDESQTSLDCALLDHYRSLADFLDGEAPLISDAVNALPTQEVCEALKSQPLNQTWRPTDESGDAARRARR
jgi:predicted dehydrogenase